jgi:23S rRNA pseudouridine955/2504/2580 synthase
MPNPPVRSIAIQKRYQNQRLDNFLFANWPKVPKSRIYRAIRKGECRINGKRVQAKYRLQANDRLRMPPLHQPTQGPQSAPVSLSPQWQRLLTRQILYENNELLVVNKPAGMPVHGGSGLQGGLIEYLRLLYANDQLELAHRLDKLTSGCLVIAKKRATLVELHRLLREQKIRKTYSALVKGCLESQEQILTFPLRKNQLRSGERMVVVDKQQGYPAQTMMQPQHHFANSTLVKISLQTGRTHQIRVHCAANQTPIAGDAKYGEAAFNRLMKTQYGLQRMFLHAARVQFYLAHSTKHIDVQADLDTSLNAFLKRLPSV